VHVIRVGRDVVASVEAAARSFPRGRVRSMDPAAVAARWAGAVASSRRQAEDAGLRYAEVRYEDLRRDTAVELGRIFEFCEIPADEALVTRIVEESAIEVRRSGERDAFRRRGEVGGWRDSFGLRDRLRFERAA